MAHRWIVTALGADQPGIVAGVTKILFEQGCNLEDSTMTRLEGEFAIMLIFSAPAGAAADVLRRAFSALEQRQGLVVHLKPLSGRETTAPKKRGALHRISVYGADRPGIVYRISALLSRAGVNITDVHTHRSAGHRRTKDAPSLYLLLLEVELPRARSRAWLERTLKQTAARLGVEVSLRSSEPEVL